jgi:outer membrane protein assembly factor BamB
MRAHANPNPLRPTLLVLLLLSASTAPLAAGAAGAGLPDAPWPRFRGPDANAASDDERLPLTWSTTENVEWVAEVPGMGWSSPIVAGGRVFLTAATSEKEMKPPEKGTDYSNEYVAELMQQGLSQEEVMARVTARDMELPSEITLRYLLLAYDLESGRELWRRTLFEGPPPGGRHRKNSYTSETPVTDGESVFVHVGNLGLWAFSLDGEPRWHTELEAYPVYLDFGTGGSPALAGDLVVVLNDNQESQFLAAFDKRSGKQVWRTPRDLGPPSQPMRRSGWSTPFVWEHEQRTEIVAQGPYTVVSYDLGGKELWRMAGHSLLPAPSPFAYDGRLYLVSGVHGDDFRPIAAILPGAAGDLTLPDKATRSEAVLWYDRVAGTYIPTPVAYRDSLWVVYDKGILARYDASTGERLFRERIPGSAGAFSASPWAYRGKVLAVDEEGTTFVFEAGEETDGLVLVGENRLDEMVLASPALVGDRLLLRTRTKLYSIREAGGRAAP